MSSKQTVKDRVLLIAERSANTEVLLQEKKQELIDRHIEVSQLELMYDKTHMILLVETATPSRVLQLSGEYEEMCDYADHILRNKISCINAEKRVEQHHQQQHINPLTRVEEAVLQMEGLTIDGLHLIVDENLDRWNADQKSLITVNKLITRTHEKKRLLQARIVELQGEISSHENIDNEQSVIRQFALESLNGWEATMFELNTRNTEKELWEITKDI